MEVRLNAKRLDCSHGVTDDTAVCIEAGYSYVSSVTHSLIAYVPMASMISDTHS